MDDTSFRKIENLFSIDNILTHKRIISIFLGIILIFFSLIVEKTDSFEGSSILVSLFRELGVTFIIIGTILIFFERHLNSYFELSLKGLETKLDNISKEVDQTLGDFQKTGKLINEGAKAGIINIYENRNSQIFRDKICNELDIAEGDICILGIALGDFFSSGHPFCGSLKKRINDNARINIRVLLLNPFSNAARERTRLEFGTQYYIDPLYHNSELFMNIKRSFFSISDFKKIIEKENYRCKIDLKFYDTDPQLYMVFVNKHIFVEQYHFGKSKKGCADYDCIGRKVPILELEDKSPINIIENKDSFYDIMIEHFEYLWNRPETKSALDLESSLMSNGVVYVNH